MRKERQPPAPTNVQLLVQASIPPRSTWLREMKIKVMTARKQVILFLSGSSEVLQQCRWLCLPGLQKQSAIPELFRTDLPFEMCFVKRKPQDRVSSKCPGRMIGLYRQNWTENMCRIC